MDLQTAILSKDINNIDICLETEDINAPTNTGTPILWAIVGGNYSPERVGNGDLNIVKHLLKKGADPNKKYNAKHPVIIAAIEGNHHILTRLIMHGAEVDCYNMRLKTINGSKVCLCRTALVHAIENLHVECVKSLVYSYAIYNEKTVELAESLLEKCVEDAQLNLDKWDKWRKATAIYKVLKNEYSELCEGRANEYMRKHNNIGQYLIIFRGMSSHHDYYK